MRGGGDRLLCDCLERKGVDYIRPWSWRGAHKGAASIEEGIKMIQNEGKRRNRKDRADHDVERGKGRVAGQRG